ncbi:zinc finger BED domain-containing protein RICESLEEPER 2-like [Senna tora]|uniref:Zinc finger BED domain-containing protein RICESLEEPER 2-like n=1 Tax=Senna tora TaxID=362788 RepID=A0A834T0J3_9FABA|nr:zinc finger BED domain-containing protein RICESLEEPER 2-like [Senna tora]
MGPYCTKIKSCISRCMYKSHANLVRLWWKNASKKFSSRSRFPMEFGIPSRFSLEGICDDLQNPTLPGSVRLVWLRDFGLVSRSPFPIQPLICLSHPSFDYSRARFLHGCRGQSSPARFQRFKDLVQKEKIDCKALVCLDIVTGWNSTYLMLEHALKFQKVFDRMEDEDDGYNEYFRDDTHWLGPPMTYDWSNAYVFVQLLKVFYTITLRFSGSLYVTSNSCFHDIAHVHTMLQVSVVHQDPLIGEMAKSMKLKYDKYWGKPENMNPLLVIRVVLDPRYKFGYLNNTFNDIYDDPIVCARMKKKVKDTLYFLYDKYSVGVVGKQFKHQEESGDSGAINHPGDLPMPDFVTANPKGKWWSGRTKHPSYQKTDLNKYLETDAIDDDPSFDVLTWWRENAIKYKVVSLVARDVLAIPVSTVASESAFSTGGRMLDVFRSSLSQE